MASHRTSNRVSGVPDPVDQALSWMWVVVAERGVPQADTQYDRGKGCPMCGTGSRQIGPLRISVGDLPKKSLIAQTYTGEIMVAQALADSLPRGIGHPDLRQVEDRRSGLGLAWWQVLPRSTLPPFAPETRGVSRHQPCSVCNRDGYFHSGEEPFAPAYRKAAVFDQSIDELAPRDFWFTFEHYGNSYLNTEADPTRVTHYAQPLIMVSGRIAALFMQSCPRTVNFVHADLA